MAAVQTLAATLLPKILARSGWISAISFVATILYTLYAISEVAVEPTRISENALLPGLVAENFQDSRAVPVMDARLKKNMESRKDIRDFIYAELKARGLEAYRQNFKRRDSSFSTLNSSKTSENIFGIVRAFRAAPVESILIVVEMDPKQHKSISMALTLADYAREQIYWARDVIFLFVDDGKLGAEAWLASFYGLQENHKFFGQIDELEARGGPIIGAVVLDLIGDEFAHINIQYGMVNGRLPNLDLINLFTLLVEKANAAPTIYDIIPVTQKYHTQNYAYLSALQTFLRGIVSQSFVEFEGLHSVLGGYGLNAITLQARRKPPLSSMGNPPKGPRFNMDSYADSYEQLPLDDTQLVRIVEGGLRSLNNILEKFHQSYFLYLLTNPHRFISVAFYQPIICLLILPLLILALNDWFRSGQVSGMAGTLFTILVLHLWHIFIYSIAIFLFQHPNANAKYVAIFTILAPMLPMFLIVEIDSNLQFYFLRFFTALEMALFIGALSLLHFPLAFSLGLPLVVFAGFVLLREKRTLKARIFGFLVHNPITLMFVIAICLDYFGIFSFFGISKIGDFFNSKSYARIWHRGIGFVRRTVFNHLAHSSALFPIFMIGFGSIFSLLMRIFVYDSHDGLENGSKTESHETETLIGKKRSHDIFNESGTEDEEESHKRSKTGTENNGFEENEVEEPENPIQTAGKIPRRKRSKSGSRNTRETLIETEELIKNPTETNNLADIEEVKKRSQFVVESALDEIERIRTRSQTTAALKNAVGELANSEETKKDK